MSFYGEQLGERNLEFSRGRNNGHREKGDARRKDGRKPPRREKGSRRSKKKK